MQGCRRYTRLALVLMMLAAPSLAAATGTAAPSREDALAGTTAVTTLVGRVALPVALPEVERQFVRELERGLTSTETVRFAAPDGGELALEVSVASPEGVDATFVAQVLEQIAGETAFEPGVDEIRRVPVGGFSFHAIRRSPPDSTEDEGRAPDPEDERHRAHRIVALLGAVQQVLVQVTVRLPESLADQEEAVLASLIGVELDFASLLQQRAAFDEEAALAVSQERISTLFGDIATMPEMAVQLVATHRVETADGVGDGNLQSIAFGRRGLSGVHLATLSLSCEYGARDDVAREVQGFVDQLRERRRRGPEASRIGPLPAQRWAGRDREERGIYRILRVAEADGIRYVARVDHAAAGRFAGRLEAWLDDGAMPQCAPRLPVQVGG